MKILKGGIGNVSGFSSAGKHIGIKHKASDFAVLYADRICDVGAVFTQNTVKGAPVYVNIDHLEDHKAQAIVVNSGNANVATGQKGLKNAYKTAELTAKELGIKKQDVLVASTGVIGVQLPIEKVKKGIKGVKKQLKRSSDFAEAIMTTDTFKKEICVEHDNFKIAGAAKGAGMIEPNMATMLAFLVTDANIPAHQLNSLLKNSVNKTFNMTSVDTDTSTSDMVILMSNGQTEDVDADKFSQALDLVCLELTKMIARDGEGATKLIICDVNGAKSEADAKKIAKSVINSPLVKTAVYGNDPNWGRLMMAIGKTGSEIDEEKIDISINGSPIVKAGKAASTYDAQKLIELFKQNDEINIGIDLNIGSSKAVAYGCDLNEEYIKINAEYTT